METKNNTKRNILIALAVIALICVYSFSSCMGKVVRGVEGATVENAPERSYAIINISGTIQASPSSPFENVSYNHDVLMNYVDGLMDDETNYGILLKVNSGGGTVYHSDEMYLKLMEYKEKTGRPIYAYFEQTAASGAYYISCAADYIMANRNCWTGSIGVIISYTNMEGLYNKLGLEQVIIASGANKGMGDSAKTLTDEQRAIYQALVDESYETFVGIVAQGRNMDIETVKQIADGRVYTASQALENGLVDRVCSWQQAQDKMNELTGVEGYEKSFYTTTSLLNYFLSEIKQSMPKSDMQSLQDMFSESMNGVPLYYYAQ